MRSAAIGRRLARDGFGGQQRRHEGLDLGHREREGGAAEVRDLALRAQPLDAERRVVARHQEQVEAGRREADQRLHEPPRAGGAVDLVTVVEDQQEVVLEDVLHRVGDQRGGGLAAVLRLGLVTRVDRRGDRGREVLGQRRQLAVQGRDDARGERAQVRVGPIDRVPGGRPAARRPGGEGALAEARARDDDRQPPLGALPEGRLERRAIERAVGVARWDQLGRAADPPRPGPGRALALQSPLVHSPLRWLGARMVRLAKAPGIRCRERRRPRVRP